MIESQALNRNTSPLHTACEKPLLVDSHAHLDFPPLKEDLPAVLREAYNAGVGAIVSIGTKPSGWSNILEIVQTQGAQNGQAGVPALFATVGVHPCDSGDVKSEALTPHLETLLSHPQVIGLGETGLDFFHTPFDADHQRACLDVHAELGLKYDLPLVIHSRNAEEATVKALGPWMKKGLRAVMHCFAGSADFAKACVEMGCYISFSGIITFKKTEALQDVVRQIPFDRLLVETDAPYLAPMPYRGKRNQPAFVHHTALKAAELRGVTLPDLTKQTTQNFLTLFSKACQTLQGKAMDVKP